MTTPSRVLVVVCLHVLLMGGVDGFLFKNAAFHLKAAPSPTSKIPHVSTTPSQDEAQQQEEGQDDDDDEATKIVTESAKQMLQEEEAVNKNDFPSCIVPPFTHVLAANRAEIAVRIMRAATELNCGTVAIYSPEDAKSQHRWGADRSFVLKKKEESATPISAYLDIEQIIDIAKQASVDAIHPGYGFLSESPELAQACADNGITFVGPTVDNLLRFSDKTTARQAAIDAGVPVVPGSDGALQNEQQVVEFVESSTTGGLPVILKAAMGGGGKGMRIVRTMEELIPMYHAASSEALASFGDGSVFVERLVHRPRHVEVQILGDGTGNVVHLYERDCSVQRRHQKVIELAPAWNLPQDLRSQLQQYAVQLMSAAKYKNAGTVEFLIDSETLEPYFIEVNPRVQVEHTVTEEVTGIDIVQAQIRIAAGATLEELGLIQSNIQPRGIAMQCRVTTENPEREFAPDTGTITVYRTSAGAGVRMDGIGYSGMTISPYFDSMIVKYTVRGGTFAETVSRMKRVLQECRIRGVKTNIGFLMNVLSHPEFERQSSNENAVTTSFLDDHPELKLVSQSMWNFASEEQADPRKLGRTERLVRYLANLAVNGHAPELGAEPTKLRPLKQVQHVKAPVWEQEQKDDEEKVGWRHVLLEQGPEGLAKAVREHQGLLLTDTTWRDAHQSLLATRMRTRDLVKIADYTNHALKQSAFSLEMWGGATFDVAMRFLHECPWQRLEQLRERVPDIPFQMLLRGANAVGYTNYPDNLVHKFCAQAHKSGIDVFRVFDSLNYLDNLQLGVMAAGEAGGFVEGTMSYTGDVADPMRSSSKYNLDYYLQLSRDLVDMGVHSLAVKDMAGLLTPRATKLLVEALRAEHADIPIHVHTHDTSGSGVASMLQAAESGADIVDAAMDAMSGMTSQPSLGALVQNVRQTNLDTGIDATNGLGPLNTYWESVRSLYAPFESGQLSGSSDVYQHEIPGGQYTNLLFQSKQLGLAEKWPQIKQAYRKANMVLGDIPKVTPSSKVVGDLAQFMVAQELEPQDILDQAESLALPDSVVNYLRGDIGVPPGGFPEPLRTKVLTSRNLEPVTGRPGLALGEYDFEKEHEYLKTRYGANRITTQDLLSYALYPKVFCDWKEFAEVYGDVGLLSTPLFLNPMQEGDEVEIELGFGKTKTIKLTSIRNMNPDDATRMVVFEVNGEAWYIPVTDLQLLQDGGAGGGALTRREKASAADPGSVGAPMPGVVVGVTVKAGDKVKEGEPVATLSAMKMETSIPATASGTVSRVLVNVGDKVEGDDLILEIE